MSLLNTDEFEDIHPRKKNGKLNSIFSKAKLVLIILLIGIILGIIIGQFYLGPMLNLNENTSLKSCLNTNELLSKENYCLYAEVENPQKIIENCNLLLDN
jgi:magnesium-transporting ATPase (P-type)